MAQPQQLSDADADQYWWPLHEGATVPCATSPATLMVSWRSFRAIRDTWKSFDGPVFLLWGTQDKVLRYDRIGSQFQRDMKIGKERTTAGGRQPLRTRGRASGSLRDNSANDRDARASAMSLCETPGSIELATAHRGLKRLTALVTAGRSRRPTN